MCWERLSDLGPAGTVPFDCRVIQKKYATGKPDQKDLNENLAATQGLAHMIVECDRLFEVSGRRGRPSSRLRSGTGRSEELLRAARSPRLPSWRWPWRTLRPRSWPPRKASCVTSRLKPLGVDTRLGFVRTLTSPAAAGHV